MTPLHIEDTDPAQFPLKFEGALPTKMGPSQTAPYLGRALETPPHRCSHLHSLSMLRWLPGPQSWNRGGVGEAMSGVASTPEDPRQQMQSNGRLPNRPLRRVPSIAHRSNNSPANIATPTPNSVMSTTTHQLADIIDPQRQRWRAHPGSPYKQVIGLTHHPHRPAYPLTQLSRPTAPHRSSVFLLRETLRRCSPPCSACGTTSACQMQYAL